MNSSVEELLNRTGFDNSNFELKPSDPITKTSLVLKVSDIDLYDHNPRRSRNQDYDDLKSSIRATRGLDNPLSVTKRPNAERYIVRAGGNTRLQILKELLEETNDPCFSSVHCVFHPWDSESKVHLAHLIENEKRSPLTLIDKAIGFKHQRELAERAVGHPLSQQQLINKLAEEGYTGLTKPTLSRLEYVAYELQDLLPEALGANSLQMRDVDRIRSLRKTYCSYWLENSPDSTEEAFESLFYQALSTVDSASFSVDSFARHLDKEMSSLLDIPVKTVRTNIDAINAGKHESRQSAEVSSNSPSNILETPSIGENENFEDMASTNRSDELRSRAYECAANIAHHFNLGPIISPIDSGYGFEVDLPSEPLSEPQHISAWWTLLSCSHQDHPDRCKHLSPYNTFGVIRSGERPNDIHLFVGTPNIQDLFTRFLLGTEIEDTVTKEVFELISKCRFIKRLEAKGV